MDVIASSGVTLWVDFEAPQGLSIPDAGSVTYSLYDGSGRPLVVAGSLTPEPEATGVSISIQAVHNVLANERAFERRLVMLNWVADGRTYMRRTGYRIVELPLYSSTPEDVRVYLSLGEDELRDTEVDLFTAALSIEQALGSTIYREALSSGTVAELKIERLIVLTAATLLFPSLRFRVLQAKTDGTLKSERLKDPTAFEGLVAATAEELRAGIEGLTGDTSAGDVVPILIQFTTITVDPITGAAPATTAGS